MTYARQLSHKQQLVSDALVRLGKFEAAREGAPLVKPIMGMEEPWRYRNKAQIPVARSRGRIVMGFFERRSHRIVDARACLIQHGANDEVMNAVREALSTLSLAPYDEHTRSGTVRHILARTSHASSETLVAIITNGRRLPRRRELLEMLRARLPGLVGVVQNINETPGNRILGHHEVTLWGRSYLNESLAGLRFRVSPRSFFQVNPVQTTALYEVACSLAGLSGTETVFDLYSGIGTIALFMSRRAGRVVGVETVGAAVDDAVANAALNGIENTEFHRGAAEDVVPGLLRQGVAPQVVVLDPPRKGCAQELLALIAAIKTRRVVYISCNPATLARDLRFLSERGYKLEAVQPVDMFPHTKHVECVTSLVWAP